MSDQNPSIQIVLKNAEGEEIKSGSVSIPGWKKFFDLPSGRYTIKFIFPESISLEFIRETFVYIMPSKGFIGWLNRDSLSITVEQKFLEVCFCLKAENTNIEIIVKLVEPNGIRIYVITKLPDKIPFLQAMLVITGIILLGHQFFVSDSLIPLSSDQFEQNLRYANQSRRLNTNIKDGDELPEDVKDRLKQCIDDNLQAALEIPSIIDAVYTLAPEEAYSDEFLILVVELYEIDQSVRAFIEECDLTSIFEDDENDSNGSDTITSTHLIDAAPFQSSVMIVGEAVNIRTDPNLDGEVIGQVSNEVVRVDIQTLNHFSEQQRLAILEGNGWLPIILSNGQRGYIYSLFMEREQSFN
ncbi:MAG: SH3 domain-containing protein [Elainellaceae cyanobacterium]